MSLLRGMATVGGLTAVSRIAGFARDILTASLLGAGPMADAFVIAVKLPNLARRLFGDGAFMVTFVPQYAAERGENGRRAALDFAGETLAVMLAVLIPLTVLALLAMPGILAVIAPGFVADPARQVLALDYARLAFPYLLLMSVSALLGGVLNAQERLAPFAAAPILFNLVLIAALLFGTHIAGSPGRALVVGVTLSGIVQVAWLALACRRHGVSIRLMPPRIGPRLKRLLVLMGPGAVGAGITQIQMFLNTLIASFLPAGAVSALYYADRLTQLPLGIVGIALGTALLPTLTRLLVEDRPQDVTATQSRAIEYALLLGLPSAAGLIALAGPIIHTLFERGAFGPAQTVAVSGALAAYALGIPAYILIRVFSTLCFARADTTTPMRTGAAATLLAVAGAVVLMRPLGHVGIALATGIAAWVNAGLLAWSLHRRDALPLDSGLRRRGWRIVLAALGMAAGLLLGRQALGAVGGGALATLIGGGVVLYTALCLLLGAVDRGELARFRRRAHLAG
ncbi:putative peptidoglycan lipid II flippase [Inquilinus ginsengisoli]|uniref:Probable lipid II flippase MurJ n=1 Tax=Inquilinus ginsengisoli TaxID=363840 RepID=A0ABU1JTN4_9PROT|nr:murein biosynthesis integral membrane protein MurJ [Inquilinus ginsengisoli]MDR6291978.1 putative peptidoglycan lipid II flippase [Inquilinus ginsengisoli]